MFGIAEAGYVAYLGEERHSRSLPEPRNAHNQPQRFAESIRLGHSSGEKDGTGDITIRKHAVMRCNLIEAAWVAVRQDPAMNLFYTEQCKRMPKSKAIVKVARKLVNRLFFVPHIPY